MALFGKLVRKLSKRLQDVQKAAVEATMPEAPSRRTAGEGDGERATTTTNWKPVETSLEDELKEAGDEATKALREKQRQMIDSLDLSK